MLTGPDVTCFSFIHSAVSCWDVCVGTMPRRCRRLWWAHGWKAAEEKITCHSESVRTPPEATTPPSMSSSPCFPPLAPALHECSFSVWLRVLFVHFQFTYLVVHSGLSASSTVQVCTTSVHCTSSNAVCRGGVMVHKPEWCSGPWNWRRNQENLFPEKRPIC